MKLLYTFVLFFLMVASVVAQQPFAIKPYAVTLPRVTTGQQTSPTTVPQQAGNIVYNTEQQAVAVHNGTDWGYLTTNTSEFPNFKSFPNTTGTDSQTYVWAIPAGVTKFMVEAWAGGNGGGKYATTTDGAGLQVYCLSYSGSGGNGQGGGYARLIEDVVPGVTSMTISVGRGGAGANTMAQGATIDGYDTTVKYNSKELNAYSGGFYGTNFGGTYRFSSGIPITDARTLFVRGGSAGAITMDYAQKDASNYVLSVHLADGGLSYGSLPHQDNRGATVVLSNGTTPIVRSSSTNSGAIPGLGGGCAYGTGGPGSPGFVIIRW